jgi:NAD(P)-dependent dehydrogenase (short-subunit alcohol dehydrogenase family)
VERRVLVTGAGSGTGLETVPHLGELGFVVTGLARDDDDDAVLRPAAAPRHLRDRTRVTRSGPPGLLHLEAQLCPFGAFVAQLGLRELATPPGGPARAGEGPPAAGREASGRGSVSGPTAGQRARHRSR